MRFPRFEANKMSQLYLNFVLCFSITYQMLFTLKLRLKIRSNTLVTFVADTVT
jgi:hypothetical protein